MPRCLMAKKWKAYPWQDRAENTISTNQPTSDTDATIAESAVNSAVNNTTVVAIEEDEEIDVVGDSPAIIATTTTDANRAAQHTATSTTTSVIVGNKLVPTCWGPSSPTAGTTAPSPPLDGKPFQHFIARFPPLPLSPHTPFG